MYLLLLHPRKCENGSRDLHYLMLAGKAIQIQPRKDAYQLEDSSAQPGLIGKCDHIQGKAYEQKNSAPDSPADIDIFGI